MERRDQVEKKQIIFIFLGPFPLDVLAKQMKIRNDMHNCVQYVNTQEVKIFFSDCCYFDNGKPTQIYIGADVRYTFHLMYVHKTVPDAKWSIDAKNANLILGPFQQYSD